MVQFFSSFSDELVKVGGVPKGLRRLVDEVYTPRWNAFYKAQEARRLKRLAPLKGSPSILKGREREEVSKRMADLLGGKELAKEIAQKRSLGVPPVDWERPLMIEKLKNLLSKSKSSRDSLLGITNPDPSKVTDEVIRGARQLGKYQLDDKYIGGHNRLMEFYR